MTQSYLNLSRVMERGCTVRANVSSNGYNHAVLLKKLDDYDPSRPNYIVDASSGFPERTSTYRCSTRETMLPKTSLFVFVYTLFVISIAVAQAPLRPREITRLVSSGLPYRSEAACYDPLNTIAVEIRDTSTYPGLNSAGRSRPNASPKSPTAHRRTTSPSTVLRCLTGLGHSLSPRAEQRDSRHEILESRTEFHAPVSSLSPRARGMV